MTTILSRAQASLKCVVKCVFNFFVMSAVQNDTVEINHCVNRAAPVSIYRDWPASLGIYVYIVGMCKEGGNVLGRREKRNFTIISYLLH